MKNYSLITFALLLSLTFFACKKEALKTEKTQIELLTSKAWRPHVMGGVVLVDCHVDDVLELESDGKVSYDPKETYCSDVHSVIPCDTDGLRWYGKWVLDEETKAITFDEDGGFKEIFGISFVSEERLELVSEQGEVLVFKH